MLVPMLLDQLESYMEVSPFHLSDCPVDMYAVLHSFQYLVDAVYF